MACYNPSESVFLSQIVLLPSAYLCRWDLPHRNLVWGQLGGQKWYHRIARPRFAIVLWNDLNISNRPAAVSVSLFSRGVCPPKLEFGGHLGEQEWYHRIARLWFAKTHLRSSEYLKPFSSYFVASFRDIHTYTHTYTHTQNLDSIMAILR